jgi:hypothetical protein
MKVLLITDQHFGVRNDSQVYVEYYKKFYSEIVIPFIEAYKIKHVLCLGDTFDRRKSINFNSLEAAKEMWFDPLESMGVKLTMLVGNHDIYYKNTLRVNAPSLLLGEYGNIQIIDNPSEFDIDGLTILGIPWICDDNRSRVYELLEKSVSPLCVGHLEFNGFETVPGVVMDHGIDVGSFKKFDKVLSGHFHTRSNKDNIYYLGNPYELYWNDYQAKRGFHILDTETLDLKFYRNPFTMFHKEFYNEDTVDLTKDYSVLQNKYIKLIVEKKEDALLFDRFVKLIYDSQPAELKIIEDLSVEYPEDDLDMESEDTMTVLEKFVDEMELKVDKKSVFGIIKTLYTEALEY